MYMEKSDVEKEKVTNFEQLYLTNTEACPSRKSICAFLMISNMT